MSILLQAALWSKGRPPDREAEFVDASNVHTIVWEVGGRVARIEKIRNGRFLSFTEEGQSFGRVTRAVRRRNAQQVKGQGVLT